MHPSLLWQSRVRTAVAIVNVIGLVSLFGALLAGRGLAQNPSELPPHLTVEPRPMATGTVNPVAGTYRLDFVPSAIVTVSSQCAGAHRCPLYVQLPGGMVSAQQMTYWLGPVAEKYGFLLLTTTEFSPEVIDRALQEVLRRFAVDPDKIAIFGRCHTGPPGMALANPNMQVFSRIGSISGGDPSTANVDPRNRTTEFLFDESYEAAGNLFAAARTLRQAGHPVTTVIALRGHENQAEDYDFVGHWLQQSWAIPDPAKRPAPAVVADPLPLLTPRALRQMITFWTRFLHEPDSVWRTARRAHLREVLVPMGHERAIAWMTDMPALAAKYPSVAADLKRAGLTARQHEAYRVAILSARVSVSAAGTLDSLPARSAFVQNVAFLRAHRDLYYELDTAGVVNHMGLDWVDRTNTVPHPAETEAMGPLGIWRMP